MKLTCYPNVASSLNISGMHVRSEKKVIKENQKKKQTKNKQKKTKKTEFVALNELVINFLCVSNFVLGSMPHITLSSLDLNKAYVTHC